MPKTTHVDVLIIGAGISGIAAARYLKHLRPSDKFMVLDQLDSFGGTWETHKYPGIRSDSDLYTFGFGFKPWVGPPIATGEEILSYLSETIDENVLGDHFTYGQTVVCADWSSSDKMWTLVVRDDKSGQNWQVSTNFLYMCQGYYRHSQGYTPKWPGFEDFEGEVIHPQQWPADFDGTGKHVVVIGSGATAATLVPNIVDQCEHVTMLQRSPTYFLTAKNANELADTLRDLEIDEQWIHTIVRKKIVSDQAAFIARCRSEPDVVKAELLAGIRAYLNEEDIKQHFTPAYRPWQQRVAFIPDGDLFKGIASGKASVETDHIERFTKTGILLKSGETLQAETVVTATGFNLCVMGDIAFSIDGTALDFSDTVTYRGMMFTGVPNLVWVFGYFRASWTLRAEMVAEFVCKMRDHMEAQGVKSVTPALGVAHQDMPLFAWPDSEDFNPGYLARDKHLLPKRGNTSEWMHTQDYFREKDEFLTIDLKDEVFVYEK